ncbi:NAD(P)H-dependent oxidoreductase [Pedobacter psychrodurus]|uniref:NAD(P)H-dependent oxidoreductase n=1 Tax=Pedobacter psychrodurus TaxID=2530456 RepID=UPI002938D369|nr:NAD(P)H-dependent oxidoreductase [Pedobacter psychrodurus]
MALAITAGIGEKEYQKDGPYKYTVKELTAPLELTFQYVKANYTSLFAFYGIEYHATDKRIAHSVNDYISFVTSF